MICCIVKLLIDNSVILIQSRRTYFCVYLNYYPLGFLLRFTFVLFFFLQRMVMG